jgi:uncharacterized membrane protein YjgN (DUF898 family)
LPVQSYSFKKPIRMTTPPFTDQIESTATSETSSANAGFVSEKPALVPSRELRYHLTFTGSGSEYFRIWIVNLLLISITLGIYYPWAKVRKAQYLHRNLLLDGAAFDYHATGGTVFKGTLIAGVLYGVYYLVDSSRSWFLFGLFTTAVCVLLPWLLWKSLRFKLSVTSYRALPFSFKASLQASYQVFVPIILYNAAILALFFYLADDQVPKANMPKAHFEAVARVFGAFALMIVVLYPLFYYWLKRYQHNHYQWTSLRTQFSGTVAAIYKEWLLIAVPFIVFYGGIGLALYALINSNHGLFGKMDGLGATVSIALIVSVYVSTLFVPLVFKALFVSRFQNLVWNNTTAQGIRFVSQLKTRSLVWQSVINLFLIAITFGLYWPFAFINVVKLRAASMSVVCAAPLMYLAAQHAAADKERNAVGDAVGELFDIDIAL